MSEKRKPSEAGRVERTNDLTTDDIETEDLVITDLVEDELMETLERMVANLEQSAALSRRKAAT